MTTSASNEPSINDPDVAAGVSGAAPDTTIQSVRHELRRQLFRSKTFIVGSLLLLFWTFAAIAPGVLTSHFRSA